MLRRLGARLACVPALLCAVAALRVPLGALAALCPTVERLDAADVSVRWALVFRGGCSAADALHVSAPHRPDELPQWSAAPVHNPVFVHDTPAHLRQAAAALERQTADGDEPRVLESGAFRPCKSCRRLAERLGGARPDGRILTELDWRFLFGAIDFGRQDLVGLAALLACPTFPYARAYAAMARLGAPQAVDLVRRVLLETRDRALHAHLLPTALTTAGRQDELFAEMCRVLHYAAPGSPPPYLYHPGAISLRADSAYAPAYGVRVGTRIGQLEVGTYKSVAEAFTVDRTWVAVLYEHALYDAEIAASEGPAAGGGRTRPVPGSPRTPTRHFGPRTRPAPRPIAASAAQSAGPAPLFASGPSQANTTTRTVSQEPGMHRPDGDGARTSYTLGASRSADMDARTHHTPRGAASPEAGTHGPSPADSGGRSALSSSRRWSRMLESLFTRGPSSSAAAGAFPPGDSALSSSPETHAGSPGESSDDFWPLASPRPPVVHTGQSPPPASPVRTSADAHLMGSSVSQPNIAQPGQRPHIGDVPPGSRTHSSALNLFASLRPRHGHSETPEHRPPPQAAATHSPPGDAPPAAARSTTDYSEGVHASERTTRASHWRQRVSSLGRAMRRRSGTRPRPSSAAASRMASSPQISPSPAMADVGGALHHPSPTDRLYMELHADQSQSAQPEFRFLGPDPRTRAARRLFYATAGDAGGHERSGSLAPTVYEEDYARPAPTEYEPDNTVRTHHSASDLDTLAGSASSSFPSPGLSTISEHSLRSDRSPSAEHANLRASLRDRQPVSSTLLESQLGGLSDIREGAEADEPPAAQPETAQARHGAVIPAQMLTSLESALAAMYPIASSASDRSARGQAELVPPGARPEAALNVLLDNQALAQSTPHPAHPSPHAEHAGHLPHAPSFAPYQPSRADGAALARQGPREQLLFRQDREMAGEQSAPAHGLPLRLGEDTQLLPSHVARETTAQTTAVPPDTHGHGSDTPTHAHTDPLVPDVMIEPAESPRASVISDVGPQWLCAQESRGQSISRDSLARVTSLLEVHHSGIVTAHALTARSSFSDPDLGVPGGLGPPSLKSSLESAQPGRDSESSSSSASDSDGYSSDSSAQRDTVPADEASGDDGAESLGHADLRTASYAEPGVVPPGASRTAQLLFMRTRGSGLSQLMRASSLEAGMRHTPGGTPDAQGASSPDTSTGSTSNLLGIRASSSSSEAASPQASWGTPSQGSAGTPTAQSPSRAGATRWTPAERLFFNLQPVRRTSPNVYVPRFAARSTLEQSSDDSSLSLPPPGARPVRRSSDVDSLPLFVRRHRQQQAVVSPRTTEHYAVFARMETPTAARLYVARGMRSAWELLALPAVRKGLRMAAAAPEQFYAGLYVGTTVHDFDGPWVPPADAPDVLRVVDAVLLGARGLRLALAWIPFLGEGARYAAKVTRLLDPRKETPSAAYERFFLSLRRNVRRACARTRLYSAALWEAKVVLGALLFPHTGALAARGELVDALLSRYAVGDLPPFVLKRILHEAARARLPTSWRSVPEPMQRELQRRVLVCGWPLHLPHGPVSAGIRRMLWARTLEAEHHRTRIDESWRVRLGSAAAQSDAPVIAAAFRFASGLESFTHRELPPMALAAWTSVLRRDGGRSAWTHCMHGLLDALEHWAANDLTALVSVSAHVALPRLGMSPVLSTRSSVSSSAPGGNARLPETPFRLQHNPLEIAADSDGTVGRTLVWSLLIWLPSAALRTLAFLLVAGLLLEGRDRLRLTRVCWESIYSGRGARADAPLAVQEFTHELELWRLFEFFPTPAHIWDLGR